MGPIRYLTSWLLYLAGHILSIPMMRFDAFAFLYRRYNSLMLASVSVQGDVTLGPWQNPTTPDENCDFQNQQGEGVRTGKSKTRCPTGSRTGYAADQAAYFNVPSTSSAIRINRM